MNAEQYAETYTIEQLEAKIERLESVAYTAETMSDAIAVCYAMQEMTEALRILSARGEALRRRLEGYEPAKKCIHADVLKPGEICPFC